MPMDPRVDAYIAASADFARPLLAWMRERVHAAVPEVDEAIKWSRPAFLLGGRPFAMMVAFKAHASFGFWEHGAAAGETVEQFDRIAGFADLPDAAAFETLVKAAAARLPGARPRRPRPRPGPRPRYRRNLPLRWRAILPRRRPSALSRLAPAATIASGSARPSGPRPRRAASPKRSPGCARASVATGSTNDACRDLRRCYDIP